MAGGLAGSIGAGAGSVVVVLGTPCVVVVSAESLHAATAQTGPEPRRKREQAFS